VKSIAAYGEEKQHRQFDRIFQIDVPLVRSPLRTSVFDLEINSRRALHARGRSLSGTRGGESLNLSRSQFGFVLIDQFEKEFFQVGLLMLFGQFLD